MGMEASGVVAGEGCVRHRPLVVTRLLEVTG
jgi:hypothetical protein